MPPLTVPRQTAFTFTLLLLSGAPTMAQQRAEGIGARLLQVPAIAAAVAAADDLEPWVQQQQV